MDKLIEVIGNALIVLLLVILAAAFLLVIGWLWLGVESVWNLII